MYYDLNNDCFVEKKESSLLGFMYNNVLGRLLLKIIMFKFFSVLVCKYMNSGISKVRIKRFIKKNNINMDDYVLKDYLSFNDFFTREIKSDKRKIEDGLIAVCDSKLSVYKIKDDSSFCIKNSIYTIEELIGEKKNYKYALVFRLCVDDYHHYVFPDNGVFESCKHINGRLHTVQPIAQKKYKVFHENTRDITFLNCDTLGDVCYIEVGALLIGKIVNNNKKEFIKGEEKGYFEFGGSTVIMLIDKDVRFNRKILENSCNDIETIVKLGQNIGYIK